ncbi:MAG: hypothetical protein WAX69_04625 [Victivallales bacterium]
MHEKTWKCVIGQSAGSVPGLLPGTPPTWWHLFNRAGKLPAFRSCRQERATTEVQFVSQNKTTRFILFFNTDKKIKGWAGKQ